MAHITWLASYPKSGNTWLRTFLANYQGNDTKPFDINRLPYFSHGEMAIGLFDQAARKSCAHLTDEEVHRLRPQVHRIIAGLDREPNFVKTHNALATLFGVATVTPEVTRNAIYVIRNPLDVVLSSADHYGTTIDAAIDKLASPQNSTLTTGKNVFQFHGSWSDHVRSWSTAPGLNACVVRYEDMLDKPLGAFGRIVEYIGWRPERDRLRRAIRFASFRVLRGQEQAHGFLERSRHSDSFFREGRAGQWQSQLTSKQIDAVTETHGAVMADYGYLP